MNNYCTDSLDSELDRLSSNLQNLLDNLDNITEDDIDPELLAQVRSSMKNSELNSKKSPKEIAEAFFPNEL